MKYMGSKARHEIEPFCWLICDEYCMESRDTYEIIGNIYENQDLLTPPSTEDKEIK